MLSETLPEEIARAVFTHVSTITNLKIYIDGQDRDTNKFPEFIEVRYDGPFLRSAGKDSWLLEYDINILVQTEAGKNLYAIEKVCGKLYAKLAQDIEIMSGGSIIACSTLKTDFRQKLQINRFGRIEPDVTVLQASVEARHEFSIEV